MKSRIFTAVRARLMKRNLLKCGCKLLRANHIVRKFIINREGIVR